MSKKQCKIRLSDPRGIVQKLRENEAIFLGAAKEKTIKIDSIDEKLKKRQLSLCIRRGFSNTISLQGDNNCDLKSSKYIETEIEDIDSLLYIFTQIGFSSTKVMEKYRTKWIYKKIFITIDELPFGIFMKLEGSDDEVLLIKKEFNLMNDENLVDTYWKISEKECPGNNDVVFQAGDSLKLINM